MKRAALYLELAKSRILARQLLKYSILYLPLLLLCIVMDAGLKWVTGL